MSESQFEVTDFSMNLPLHIPVVIQTQGEIGRTLPVFFSLTRGNMNFIPVHCEYPMVTPDRMPVHFTTHSLFALGRPVDSSGRPLPRHTAPRFPILIRIWNYVVNTLSIRAQLSDFNATAEIIGTAPEIHEAASDGDLQMVYAVHEPVRYLGTMSAIPAHIQRKTSVKTSIRRYVQTIPQLLARTYSHIVETSLAKVQAQRLRGVSVARAEIVTGSPRKLAILNIYVNILSNIVKESLMKANLHRVHFQQTISLTAKLHLQRFHTVSALRCTPVTVILASTKKMLFVDLLGKMQSWNIPQRVALYSHELKEKSCLIWRTPLQWLTKQGTVQVLLSTVDLTGLAKCRAVIREVTAKTIARLLTRTVNGLTMGVSQVKAFLHSPQVSAGTTLRTLIGPVYQASSAYLRAFLAPVDIARVLAWIHIWPRFKVTSTRAITAVARWGQRQNLWMRTAIQRGYSEGTIAFQNLRKTVTTKLTMQGLRQQVETQLTGVGLRQQKAMNIISTGLLHGKTITINFWNVLYRKIQPLRFLAELARRRVQVAFSGLSGQLRKWITLEPKTQLAQNKIYVHPQMMIKQQKLVRLFLKRAQQFAKIQWWIREVSFSSEGYSLEVIFDLDERGAGIGPLPPTGIESWEGGYVDYPFTGMGTESIDSASGYLSPEGEQWVKNAAMLWQAPTPIFGDSEAEE